MWNRFQSHIGFHFALRSYQRWLHFYWYPLCVYILVLLLLYAHLYMYLYVSIYWFNRLGEIHKKHGLCIPSIVVNQYIFYCFQFESRWTLFLLAFSIQFSKYRYILILIYDCYSRLYQYIRFCVGFFSFILYKHEKAIYELVITITLMLIIIMTIFTIIIVIIIMILIMMMMMMMMILMIDTYDFKKEGNIRMF